VRNLSIKLYRTYACYMNIMLYHIRNSVWYYPWFHLTAVNLGTYNPWIRGSACTSFHCIAYSLLWPSLLLLFYCVILLYSTWLLLFLIIFIFVFISLVSYLTSFLPPTYCHSSPLTFPVSPPRDLVQVFCSLFLDFFCIWFATLS
jgi:hypothetical protein